MQPGGQFTTRVTQQFYQDIPGLPRETPYMALLLFDFATGDADILSGHDEGLRAQLYPQLGPGMRIYVVGFASRRWTDQENMLLSDRRAARVAQRIAFQSGRSPNVQALCVGETRSQADADENSAYHRAALIMVYREPPYVEPAQPVRVQPLPLSNRFRIALTWGIEGGEAIVGGRYYFVIDYDDEADNAPPSDPCHYRFVGFGGGVGTPAGTQGGVAWNRFTYPALASTRDFAGRASLHGAGATAGSLGFSRGGFYLNPDRGPDFSIENFQTEYSAGAGFSIIYGSFYRA